MFVLSLLGPFVRSLLVLIYAIFYRCRGGFEGTGRTQLGRLIYWVIPVAVWASFINPMVGWLCGIMAFVGLMIPTDEFQNDASALSVAGMAGIGFGKMLFILAPLAYFNPNILIYAPIGFLQGAAYYIGWKFLNGVKSPLTVGTFKFLGITFASGNFAIAGSEWAEALTGAVFGLAFALIGA